MKRYITLALAMLLLAVVSPAIAKAQVKAVQMKIDGYLCGF